ncbi:MAG: hypothetical protein J0L78_02450 [Planctomycetes bacterium]|nr:hypothetical protein [Planctomycetota bacterium]
MSAERRLRLMIADLDGAARREIAEAASEGRFDELEVLAPLAKEIAALAARWGAVLPTGPTESSSIGAAATPHVDVDTIPERPHKSAGRTKKTEYPQFLREKQDLVKLGWSPREKGPYEHRVPKAGVDAVVAAVASRGKSGHRFAMEEIPKALAGTKGAEPIPSYQIYAVVSWLKWAGMVIQHGRQGYTVVRPQTFASSIETAWQSLPQR